MNCPLSRLLVGYSIVINAHVLLIWTNVKESNMDANKRLSQDDFNR